MTHRTKTCRHATNIHTQKTYAFNTNTCMQINKIKDKSKLSTCLTVGAHRRMFSSVFKAVSASLLCILLRLLYPVKASWAQLGRLVIALSCYTQNRGRRGWGGGGLTTTVRFLQRFLQMNSTTMRSSIHP